MPTVNLAAGADIKRVVDDGKILFAYDRVRNEPARSATAYFSASIETVRGNRERYAEAEPWVLEGYELLLQSAGPSDRNTWHAWTRVVAVYAGWGRSEQLIPMLQRVMDLSPPAHVLDVWAWNVLVHPNLATSVYELSLLALRRADTEAVGELFEECRNYLLLIASAAVGKGLQAKLAATDLVQETFVKLCAGDCRLLREFQSRGYLLRAFYFTAVVEDQEYSSIRPLIDWLDYNGYTMVTKPTKEFTDATGRRKIKGNMDIELTVDALDMAPFYDHFVPFSGDGDFTALVASVGAQGKRREHQARGLGCRDVLEAVDGEVDHAIEQRHLQLAHEQALAAHRGEPGLHEPVTLRAHRDHLDGRSRGLQAACDVTRLGERQGAAARGIRGVGVAQRQIVEFRAFLELVVDLPRPCTEVLPRFGLSGQQQNLADPIFLGEHEERQLALVEALDVHVGHHHAGPDLPVLEGEEDQLFLERVLFLGIVNVHRRAPHGLHPRKLLLLAFMLPGLGHTPGTNKTPNAHLRLISDCQMADSRVGDMVCPLLRATRA